MWEYISTGFKVITAGVAALCTYLFGAWDVPLGVLCAVVVIDYITGVVGAIVQGNLSSAVGFKGIAKKVAIFAVVAVGHLIGVAAASPEIGASVVGFYIANEAISILENCGKIGLPLPDKLVQILEQLKNKDK